MDPTKLGRLRDLDVLDPEQLEALERLTDLSPGELDTLERVLLEDVFGPLRTEARERLEAGEDTSENIATLEATVAAIEAVRTERDDRPDARQIVAALSDRILGDDEQDPAPTPSSPTPSRPRLPRPPASRATVRSTPATIVSDAGHPLDGERAVAERFLERARELRARNAHGRRNVATVQVSYPEDRKLGSDPVESTRRIEATVAAAREQTAAELAAIRTATVDDLAAGIVSDGGLCAPTNVSYDVFGVSSDERPFRDGILRFNADRGGIRFIPPPTLSDVAAGVAVVTEAEDTAGDTDKPCVSITCGEETEELVSAVSKCLEVGNFVDRTFPESVAANLRVLAAEHARQAETELWDRAVAASTGVFAGQVLGFYRDFVENLVAAATHMRSRHRALGVPVRVVAPDWAVPMASVDLLRQLPGDDTYAVAEAFLRRSLAAHNIALTLTPDTGQEFGTQADGIGILPWPLNIEVLCFFEGTFLHLDNGMLDLGVVRDSTLNASNLLQMFSETFEGIAMVGVESLHLDMTICADGSSSGTIDIDPCTTGS